MPIYFFCFKKKSRWLIWLLLLFQFSLAAQKQESFYKDSLFNNYADASIPRYDAARAYYIIKWFSTPPPHIKVLRQLNLNTAIIFIKNNQQFENLQTGYLLAAARHEWKLSPAAERLLQQKPHRTYKIIVAGTNIDSLQQMLSIKMSSVKKLSLNQSSKSLIVECSGSVLKTELLPNKEITFIDVVSAAHAETGIIGYDRTFHGINTVDYEIPGADGKNIVVGIKEQLMDAADIDLHNRVAPSTLAAPNTSYHATVIASLIGGAGNSFYDGRGIANGCTFFPSNFDNLFADDATILTDKRVTVQNHSYGTIVQQFYGAEALSYDDLVWKHQNIVPVFSAGNQGDAAALEGPYKNLPGFANLTGNFKMAKNIITVGAVDNSENLVVESSSGPLYDGRVAPQLVALGPNGTSDAAAIVSGTIAVMQQLYADSNSHVIPSASLIKAILYNTADDIYTPGIDYKTGYGILNSYAAVTAVQQHKFIVGSVQQNDTWTTNITVPVNTANLKVTLAWIDSAAALNSFKALTTDLDLEVTRPGNDTVFLPWVLNSAPNKDSLESLPLRKRDSLNTTEQVTIAKPAPGVYQLKVRGSITGDDAAFFHVAYSTDTINTFHFTSPLHASDIALAVNGIVTVRWRVFTTTEHETGKLYVSYNSGTSWQLLKANVPLKNQKYIWTIKDTTTAAQLKMETVFGNFFSTPLMMARLTKPMVNFVCTDSFGLSWNRHQFANSYKVYTLTDSPFMQPVLTVTDSFVVLQRQQFTGRVYAVQPMLVNGLQAARSAAVDIEEQGVQCFYKTLNYDLLDDNRLKLLLELSTTDAVDSVAFEKVTSAGRLLQTYSGSAVNAIRLIYSFITEDVSSGVTYLRGRIRLKNGVMIYTNIVPVLTSGKYNILFYPNPASIKNQLHYVLRQGLPSNTRLQFFDAAGRLFKTFPSLPDNIDLTGFSAGIVVYKLISESNTVLQTGKLVLH